MIRGHGHSFVVKSVVGKTTYFDWCGSISRALNRRAVRIATGEYTEVFIQRLRLTKGRKRGTKRILYASHPLAVWHRPAVAELPMAA